MRALWLLAAVLGCRGSADGGADAAPPPPGFRGGLAVAPGCDYPVTTGLGASAPEPPGDLVGPDPEPFQIHLGLAADPARTMVVTWRTRDDVSEPTALELSAAGGPSERRTGLTWRYQSRGDLVHRIHEVHLCALEPDTEYEYRVASGGAPSPPARFRTAPDLAADPNAEVVALAIGDARNQPEVLGRLLERADALAAPQLILFTGDAVASGSDQSQWDALFEAAGPLLQRVPLVAAIGNHEDGDIPWFSQLALPGDERWFSIDAGAAHIVVLEDATLSLPDETGAGAAFLAADLAAAPPGRWRIAVHHQPIYSSPGAHGPTEALRAAWLPLYEQLGVTLVINGHDHKYERTVPLRGDLRDDALGIVYLITGNAGAPLHEISESWFTAATVRAPNFVVLRWRRDRIELKAYLEDGTLIDSWARHSVGP